MPLSVKWSKFTRRNLDRIEPVYGVYELADEHKNVTYIGQGILSERLLTHKRTKKAHYFRFEKTGGKQRAEQRERAEMNAYLRRYGALPARNKRREHPPQMDWWE